MAALPTSVQEMLDGADEEFQKLNAEIRTFFDRKPYEVVTEHHDNFTKHTQHLRFTEPFPAPRWGRLFYLGVQQLRSALDHLIYAIAVNESGQNPPPDADTLAFPVVTNPGDLKLWRVDKLSDPVKAAIKWAQVDVDHPEKGTLWHLDKLNSSDKHRIIRMTLTQLGPLSMSAVTDSGGGKVTLQWHLVGLEEGAPFHTVITEKSAPNVKVHPVIAPQASIERVGGSGKPLDFLPLLPVVQKLRDDTRLIVARVAEAAGF